MGAHPPVRALPQPHVAMAHNILSRSWIMLMIIILKVGVTSSGKSDAEILLKFRESLEHNGELSDWDAPKPPCSGDVSDWKGILCDGGAVRGIKLENLGLKGSIDVDTLKDLSSLRSLSIMNNEFEGSLPEFRKLSSLRTLYLSYNKFSGVIPTNSFEEMMSLRKLHMSNNKFSGPIPSSLANDLHLVELTLENNEFEGPIPNFKQTKWTIFNVSNNKLDGPIPANLNFLDAGSFSGNKDLCGAPLQPCAAPPGTASETPPPSEGRPTDEGLSVVSIVIIVIVVAVVIAAIVAVVIIFKRRKTTTQQEETTRTTTSKSIPEAPKMVASADLDKLEQGSSASPECPPSDHGKKSDQNVKLSFLKDDRERFDMTDLLRASAEILGGGVFGSTYKAVINDGSVMVVKRYRHMNTVGKEEFHEHMRRLGRLNHKNVLPLVAYYYRKEEKLLICEHVQNASLAVHLHGSNKSRGPQRSPDWPTRLKVVKGVARGLMYLYNELPSIVAPHGHLKSSNVLLNASYEPLLVDYGLLPIVNQKHAQENMIAYKSPESKQTGQLMKKSDVWSLGLLILETLTGKFPPNFLQQGKGSNMDLTAWVQSIVPKEPSSTEVLDKDMAGTKGSEGEIVKLLRIGFRCCEADVDKRLDIKEAVEKIEEVREKDNDDDFYSSYTSETDMRSSRGLSDDFNAPPPSR